MLSPRALLVIGYDTAALFAGLCMLSYMYSAAVLWAKLKSLPPTSNSTRGKIWRSTLDAWAAYKPLSDMLGSADARKSEEISRLVTRARWSFYAGTAVIALLYLVGAVISPMVR